jgi:hypothetical protein
MDELLGTRAQPEQQRQETHHPYTRAHAREGCTPTARTAKRCNGTVILYLPIGPLPEQSNILGLKSKKADR